MFQGTNAKPQNAEDVAALRSCILDLNTEAIFVILKSHAKLDLFIFILFYFLHGLLF